MREPSSFARWRYTYPWRVTAIILILITLFLLVEGSFTLALARLLGFH